MSLPCVIVAYTYLWYPLLVLSEVAAADVENVADGAQMGLSHIADFTR
jgi:hypothetical protein